MARTADIIARPIAQGLSGFGEALTRGFTERARIRAAREERKKERDRADKLAKAKLARQEAEKAAAREAEGRKTALDMLGKMRSQVGKTAAPTSAGAGATDPQSYLMWKKGAQQKELDALRKSLGGLTPEQEADALADLEESGVLGASAFNRAVKTKRAAPAPMTTLERRLRFDEMARDPRFQESALRRAGVLGEHVQNPLRQFFSELGSGETAVPGPVPAPGPAQPPAPAPAQEPAQPGGFDVQAFLSDPRLGDEMKEFGTFPPVEEPMREPAPAGPTSSVPVTPELAAEQAVGEVARMQAGAAMLAEKINDPSFDFMTNAVLAAEDIAEHVGADPDEYARWVTSLLADDSADGRGAAAEWIADQTAQLTPRDPADILAELQRRTMLSGSVDTWPTDPNAGMQGLDQLAPAQLGVSPDAAALREANRAPSPQEDAMGSLNFIKKLKQGLVDQAMMASQFGG